MFDSYVRSELSTAFRQDLERPSTEMEFLKSLSNDLVALDYWALPKAKVGEEIHDSEHYKKEREGAIPWRRLGHERAARSSSCSRNAHDKNVLVRRAQSRIDQATLGSNVGEKGWSLMIFCARAVGAIQPVLKGKRRDVGRTMRARQVNLSPPV